MLWGLFWTFLRVDVNKHESSHIMFLGINECGKIPPVQQLAHLGWRSLVYCNFSVEFLGLQSFELLFDWLKRILKYGFLYRNSISFELKWYNCIYVQGWNCCFNRYYAFAGFFHAWLFNATRKTWRACLKWSFHSCFLKSTSAPSNEIRTLHRLLWDCT